MSSKTRVSGAGSHFVKIMDPLIYSRQTWEVWRDFIVLAACSISNAVDHTEGHYDCREKLYMDTIGKYKKSEIDIFPELLAEVVNSLEQNQDQDYLGALYMELELSNHWQGQFFTPYCVCRFMGEIAALNPVEEIERKGFITISDPCCGAGTLLIAGVNTIRDKIANSESNLNWQNHILVVAQDIDMVVGLMCYIQISLLGCAGYVKIGNSLTDPIHTGDSDENYWYTPMYFSKVWNYRRLWHSFSNMFGAAADNPSTTTEPDDEPIEPPELEPVPDKPPEPPQILHEVTVGEYTQFSLF